MYKILVFITCCLHCFLVHWIDTNTDTILDLDSLLMIFTFFTSCSRRSLLLLSAGSHNNHQAFLLAASGRSAVTISDTLASCLQSQQHFLPPSVNDRLPGCIPIPAPRPGPEAGSTGPLSARVISRATGGSDALITMSRRLTNNTNNTNEHVQRRHSAGG